MVNQGAHDQALIRCSRFEGVETITLNRPAKKNAINLSMWKDLEQVLERIANDHEIRVVIIKGEGDAFSAGADIAEFSTVRDDAQSAEAYEALNARVFNAIRNCPVPTIAAIDGSCHGAGFGIASACDLRLATSRSRFSVPVARLGLTYPLEAIEHIVWALGAQAAQFMMFTGDHLDAKFMKGAGFLLEIVDQALIAERAHDLAQIIASRAPLSVKASKLAIRSILSKDEAAARSAAELSHASFTSADYVEGRLAFAEKRPAIFHGE